MNLRQRVEKLEEQVGGVGKRQGATLIEIAPSLKDAEKEQTPQHIRLMGRLWATALEGSAFSPEQIASLRAEYAGMTPEHIAAEEQNPATFIQVWPNGFQLRTNVDLRLV